MYNPISHINPYLEQLEKDKKILHEKAYYYSTATGQLRVYEGCIKPYPNNSNPQLAYFITPTKNLLISRKEGEIYNNSIWFLENNEIKAINSLLEYERKQIEALQDKIQNHKDKIALLNSIQIAKGWL